MVRWHEPLDGRRSANRSELGVRVVGFVGPEHDLGRRHSALRGDDLEELGAEQRNPHASWSPWATAAASCRWKKLLRLKARGVYIQDGPEYYESVTGKIPLESLRLSWLLFSPGFHVRAALRLYKRVFSFALGGPGHPHYLAAHAAGRALLFASTRLGRRSFGRSASANTASLFTVFKFRSMYDGSDKKQLTPAEHGDARVTRVGKWLRRTRIDELPQLFNIVKGDMAFVGPRPFVPEQEEECAAKIPFYRERWLVKPGATGWAQINRGYNVDPGRQSREAGLRPVLYQERFLRTRPVHHVLDRQDPAPGQRWTMIVAADRSAAGSPVNAVGERPWHWDN